MLLNETKKNWDEGVSHAFRIWIVDSQEFLQHRDDELREDSKEPFVFFAEIAAGIEKDGKAVDDEELPDRAELQFGHLPLVHDLGENLQRFVAKMRDLHDVPVVHLDHFFANQKI